MDIKNTYNQLEIFLIVRLFYKKTFDIWNISKFIMINNSLEPGTFSHFLKIIFEFSNFQIWKYFKKMEQKLPMKKYLNSKKQELVKIKIKVLENILPRTFDT